MKRMTIAAVAIVLGTTALRADDRERLYSCPDLPSPEVLDRLNLKMAWHKYVPMDGRRDGFATIRVNGTDLMVQTRSGLITVLDAETGQTRWRSRVGKPYSGLLPLAANSRSVFVFNNGYLYALDRATRMRTSST